VFDRDDEHVSEAVGGRALQSPNRDSGCTGTASTDHSHPHGASTRLTRPARSSSPSPPPPASCPTCVPTRACWLPYGAARTSSAAFATLRPGCRGPQSISGRNAWQRTPTVQPPSPAGFAPRTLLSAGAPKRGTRSLPRKSLVRSTHLWDDGAGRYLRSLEDDPCDGFDGGLPYPDDLAPSARALDAPGSRSSRR